MLNIGAHINITVEKIDDRVACCPLQWLVGLYIILWTSDICMNDLASRQFVSYWFQIVDVDKAVIFKDVHKDSWLLYTIKYLYSYSMSLKLN